MTETSLSRALCLLLTLAAGFGPAPALADALIDNVDGMTLDQDGRVVHFAGLLMSADGHVVRLLREGEKRPDRLDWRADMHGKVMLPGFVDAHGHITALGFRALSLDLSGTTSLAEAQARLAAYVAANPERKWILGGGWDAAKWGAANPTTADLDAVVSDRPVWLERADGRAGWANSAALRVAGLNPKPGGGVFEGSAMQALEKAVPQPLPKERDAAFLKAQDVLLRNGITAASDVGTSLDDWLSYRRMADIGALRVRIMSYARGVDTAIQIGGEGPTPWLYGDRLRLGGVVLAGDGDLGARTAWLKAPYADAPRESGAAAMADDVLRNRVSRAAMDRYQVAIEATGDRAVAQALGAVEEMAHTYSGDRRWRIEHARVVDPADAGAFGRNGVIAVMQPGIRAADMRIADTRLGAGRAAAVDGWATLAKSGTTLAFGANYPREAINPFIGWAAAFTRQDANAEPYGGWRAEERITREQAWRAYTMDAAYAGFAEKVFGRLAAGQRADFIIVDRDPLLASPTELRTVKVEQTWVGGEKVFEAK